MAKKTWKDLTRDELFKRIDQYLQFDNYLSLADGIFFPEAARAKAAYEAAKNELMTRFDLTENEILPETQKWVKEQYRKNYDGSYCIRCPANPGFDELVDGNRPFECATAINQRRIFYGFPKKKEDCLHASTLDDKCE
ncbi:hypothetical protein KY343_04230 [Candidatus Woesearchaeota archaeon]|nr:hypothetical protein [Candidatus Woesearchaeota archaeon]